MLYTSKTLLTLKLKRNPAIFNSYIQIKKMSSIDIDSFASQFDNMAIKGKCLTTHIDTFNYVKKNYRGQKKRQARQYFKALERENELKKKMQMAKAMLKRRKEVKVRYETHRIPVMPDAADDRVNDLHYANFLGDKYGDNNAPYNSDTYINLRFGDSMREENDSNDAQTMQSLNSWDMKMRRMNATSFDFCEECLKVLCICNPARCLCEGCIYTRACNNRDCCDIDDMSELSLGSLSELSFGSLEEYYDEELPLKRARIDDDEAEPPLKRARIDDETFNV